MSDRYRHLLTKLAARIRLPGTRARASAARTPDTPPRPAEVSPEIRARAQEGVDPAQFLRTRGPGRAARTQTDQPGTRTQPARDRSEVAGGATVGALGLGSLKLQTEALGRDPYLRNQVRSFFGLEPEPRGSQQLDDPGGTMEFALDPEPQHGFDPDAPRLDPRDPQTGNRALDPVINFLADLKRQGGTGYLTPRQMVPGSYFEQALPGARAFREGAGRDTPFFQELGDEWWDRRVPVEVRDLERIDGKLPRAIYSPMHDTVGIRDDVVRRSIPREYEKDPDLHEELERVFTKRRESRQRNLRDSLIHELVHAQQRPELLRYDGRQGELDPDLAEMFDRAGRDPDYWASPYEIEARMVPLKRWIYEQTGNPMDSPEAAREAAEWFFQQPYNPSIEYNIPDQGTYFHPGHFLHHMSGETDRDDLERRLRRVFERWAPGVVRRPPSGMRWS